MTAATSKPRVIVTRKLPSEVERELRAEFDVRLNESDTPLGADGLRRALGEADALLPTVTDRLTAEVLAAEPLRAKLLANYGVGFNHIDTAAAKARGIAVSNTPDVLTDATADLAITLLLMVTRRAGEGERELRAGRWTGWRPTHMTGTAITGKTLGLVGMGRIARGVARRAHHGFGMKVIYHDPYPPTPEDAAALGAEGRPTLEAVLEEADVVSLHCPATPETRHLMNADRLARMRRGAYLVNTARGDVVDEAALVEALRRGHLAGAGLDVFEREPKVTPALLEMEQVVLLPHLGSATREARIAMGMRALENLRLFFAGAPLRDRVV
jgi:lactate dehydrogenase-like 2-hydroxyacid dehydrogenase